MRKASILLAAAAALVATAAYAQERASGQSYDAQVNWGALKSSIDMLIQQNKSIADTVDTLNDKVTVLDGKVTTLTNTVNLLNSKVSAIADCGAAGKLWTGAGCAVIFGTPSLEDTKNINTINANFGKIASCGAHNMIWNGTACVAMQATGAGKNCGSYKDGQVTDVQVSNRSVCTSSYSDMGGTTGCNRWGTETAVVVKQCVDGTIKTVN